jgi:hypothetical protein
VVQFFEEKSMEIPTFQVKRCPFVNKAIGNLLYQYIYIGDLPLPCLIARG